MAYHYPSDVYTRQNRASTAPGPIQPSFPRGDAAIPPSLIPGYRHRQTISVASEVNGLLFPQPDRGTRNQPRKVSTTATTVGGIPEYYYVSPSTYHGPLTPALPPPPLPPQQQAALPPRPPKAPIISPSTSPILPPKPPPFLPPLPSYHHPIPRSKSQPPPPLPRGASPPFNSPPPRPPPPVLPPKPHAGRSTSVIVTASYLRPPSAIPREKVPEKAPPDTSDAASLILPSMNSPAESPLEPVTSEEEELELALKLSAHEGREYTESLLSQDEELARALEESLLDTSRPQHGRQQSSRATTTESSRLPRSSSAIAHPYSPKQPPPFPLPGRGDSSTSLASLASAQLKDDEAYARKLAAEAGYDSGPSTPTTLSNHNVDSMESYSLPSYSDIVNDTGEYARHNVWGVINGLPQAMPHLESETTRHLPHVSPTPISNERDAVPQQATTTVPPQQTPPSSQRPSPRPASLALSSSPSEDEEVPEPPSSPQASQAFATPNQFVEPELLYGVCKC
jgi:hypothetical protein